MKKLILLFIAVFSFSGYAQTESDTTRTSIFNRKHEITAGAIKLLAGPIIEFNYEYINSRDFTYGGLISFSTIEDEDYYEKFSVGPFARFYFQETKEYGAKGFFVEGFLKYSIINDYEDQYVNIGDSYTYIEREKDYHIGVIGLSLGKKWVNRTGFVFQVLLGGGRRFVGNDNAPEGIFRGDLYIGYRF